MKICISSAGDTLESPVDERFGRALKFIIADTDTGDYKVIDNKQVYNLPQGAGVQAGQTVVQAGAEAVISGHVGPKAFKVLQAAGIKIYTGANGTVKNAIADFKDGNLNLLDEADVEGHW